MIDFFVTGGTMKPGALSYVPRAADEELYQALLDGEYCTVLSSRQMGKSSLMARTASRLDAQAIQCAIVDLQGKGDKDDPQPEKWYYGIIEDIVICLGLSGDWSEWWKQHQLLLPAQRMIHFFADAVLKQIGGHVVIFIDEVDWMIHLPFSDEFFASIRSCYNRRATDSKFGRLTFALLGSAAPAQLIKDSTRTPFNISRGIELTDFKPEEARLLGRLLGTAGDEILSRIFYWTDGHPYLTQILCASLTGLDTHDLPEQLVDRVVEEKLLSPSALIEENNLKFVKERLTQATPDLRKILLVYRDVLRGRPVPNVPASPIHTSLRLSGAVKPDGERRLQVRNRVYRRVFDERWVREQMPVSVVPLTGAAVAVIVISLCIWWFVPKPTDHSNEGKYLGSGSCSASACHGSVHPSTENQDHVPILQNEYATWAIYDAHFKSFSVLETEPAKEIARVLGITDSSKSARCLACHALAPPPQLKGREFGVEGVSCESCHGASSGWFEQHFQKRATRDDLAQLGMYQIRNVVKRAEKCLSCHLGTENQEVDHRMIVAGHPDLLFELDLYSAKQPPHLARRVRHQWSST